MCGISGIVFSNNISSLNEINSDEITKIIKSIKKQELSDIDIINLSWKIKSNINFLKYCKDNNYRKNIKILVSEINQIITYLDKEIRLIDKKSSMSSYLDCIDKLQNLRDSVWFIDTEINRWIRDIEFLSSTSIHEIENNTLLFYKDVSSIIRSIDSKLELRGRDSLGITIQIKISKNVNIDLNKNKIYESINNNNNSKVEFMKSSDVINFTFKTFNKIGALGENTNILKELIKTNALLKKISSKNLIHSAIILAHTRWASVGKVNIENTHPITIRKDKNKNTEWIGAILNGDIYNYKNFLNKRKNINFDKNCTTDCLAIPNSLIQKSSKTYKSNGETVSQFKGSFAIGIFGSQNQSEVHIFKKGTQGLYIGFSDDRIMFASDVYGLIEYCRYFYPVKSDESFKLSDQDRFDLKKLNFTTNYKGTEKKISRKDIKNTNITTRDIDRKNFNHFLEKEIFDTYDISESTINRYIHHSNKVSSNSNYEFIINNSQIPEEIIKKLRRNKIKKIIITGMGTCYTAGVAISNYMREILNHINKEIIVETTIASEGSGFYLDPDMSDTLVIVIAQSGTTIDTNVYVKKAKERGALSIAIANKREGDVTFIVDGTLYIGEGRDIEISVPSTKTYTAQVLLGYILTLYFLKRLDTDNKKIFLFNQEVKKLLYTPKLVQKTLKDKSIKSSIESIKTKFLKYKSWVVAYDNSENSICANEIRIKLSENCYQAIPYLTINQVIDYKIKDSFITIISNKSIARIEQKISKIISKNNFIVLINPKIVSKTSAKLKVNESNNFINIGFSSAKQYYSFLPTILTGQLLSYYLAKIMDSRSKIFKDYRNYLLSGERKKNYLDIIKNQHKKGIFNIGISHKLINSVMENHELKFSKKIKALDELILQSRRTIDTIKHQAKTITVGAVRDEDESHKKNKSTKNFKKINSKLSLNFYDEILNSFSDKQKKGIKFNIGSSNYIYLKSEFLDEAHLYNIVNFVSEIEKKVNKRNIIKLAQPYDLKVVKQNYVLNIVKNDSENKNINTLSFSNFKPKKNIGKVFNKISERDDELKYHFWTICISIFLIEEFIVKRESKDNEDSLRSKIINLLFKDLSLLASSINGVAFQNRIKRVTRNIHKTIKNSQNIKCLGSGVNYNLAKFTSKKIMSSLNRSCAFDILENHKHIDISAESNIIIFIANIKTPGYQNDAYSEIEKIISHNNVPIIITNLEDDRFEHLRSFDNKKIKLIKLPTLPENCNFFVNIFVVSQIIHKLKNEK